MTNGQICLLQFLSFFSESGGGSFFVSWKVILQWEFRGFSSKKWWEYCMIELLEDAG